MVIKSLLKLVLLTVLFLTTYVSAQPELDTTFNSTGKLVVNGFLTNLQDMAVQPDNKTVFVSGCATINGPYNVCLGRLNENGSRDTTFNGGFVLTRIPGASADYTWQANGLALQNDGKIVVVGRSSFGAFTTSLIVVRYQSNGTLDTTFGTNGVVRTDFEANNTGNKILIQPDGKIVVVGYNKQSDTAYQQLIVRYNSDGTLDQTFSGDGFLQINLAGNYTSGSDIALQADGKILTGGVVWTLSGSPNPSAASLLVRLNRDGTFDTTFDEDGIRTVVFGTGGAFYLGFVSIAVQSDGKILGLDYNKKLYRFNLDGSLDTSFDFDGSRSVLRADSTVNNVVVTPSGKITVIGEWAYCNCWIRYPYHVGKYLLDGSIDNSFNGNGFLEIDVASNTNDFGKSATYDANGRIVLGGTSATGSVLSPYENGTWSFARLAASPAQNVGFTGRVVNADGRAITNATVTLQYDTEPLIYGRTNSFGYFRFPNLQSGRNYNLSLKAKNLTFYAQKVLVDGAIQNFMVVGFQP